jgi:hypothetical protein
LPKNCYDDDAIPIEAAITGGPSINAINTANFNLVRTQGTDPPIAIGPLPAPAEGFPKTAKLSYTPDPVSDDHDNFRLTYRVTVQPLRGGPLEFQGGDEIIVWPKTVEVTFTSDAGEAHKDTPFTITIAGGRSIHTRTDSSGKYKGTLPFGAWTVAVAPPFSKTDTKAVGRKREYKIARAQAQARILLPDPADPAVPIEQFVNLSSVQDWSRARPHGHEVWIHVGTVDDVGKEGDEINIQVEFGRESKRTTPLPELLEDKLEGAPQNLDGGRKFRGKVKLGANGKALFKVGLGKAGLDTCTVKVGTAPFADPWPGDASIRFVNWRKIYLQITRPDGGVVPDLTQMTNAFAQGGIRVERYNPVVPNSRPEARVEMVLQQVGGDATGRQIRYRDPVANRDVEIEGPGVSWFPEPWFGVGRALLNVGTNNGKFFHEKFFHNDHRPLGVHLLLVDRQYDATSVSFSAIPWDSTDLQAWPGAGGGNELCGRIPVAGKTFFPVSLKTGGTPLVSSRWKEVVTKFEAALFEYLDYGAKTDLEIDNKFPDTAFAGGGAFAGEPDRATQLAAMVTRNELRQVARSRGGFDYTTLKPLFSKGVRTGELTAADLHMPLPVGNAFWVKLPAAARAIIDSGAGKSVTLDLELACAAGPYNGESDGRRGYLILIVLTQPASDINNTILHEVGHTLGMSPHNSQPPGFVLADHGRTYVDNGHQGPHCADGMSDVHYNGGLGEVGSAYANDFRGKAECTCVLFGEGWHPGCINTYCARCLPFVKGTDVTTLMGDLWWKSD